MAHLKPALSNSASALYSALAAFWLRRKHQCAQQASGESSLDRTQEWRLLVGSLALCVLSSEGRPKSQQPGNYQMLISPIPFPRSRREVSSRRWRRRLHCNGCARRRDSPSEIQGDGALLLRSGTPLQFSADGLPMAPRVSIAINSGIGCERICQLGSPRAVPLSHISRSATSFEPALTTEPR